MPTASAHRPSRAPSRAASHPAVRLVAGVAAVALVVTTAPAASAAPRFTDVGDESPHAEAITDLAERGVVDGRTATTFEPAGTVTRGQLASMVARAADLEPTDARPFRDVVDGPHAANVAAAHAAGLVEGYEDGTFRPSQPIQRAQIAAVLHRWLAPDVGGDPQVFSDLGRTIHAEAIAALAAIDVARGSTDGTFRPTADLRRDQAASFVSRAIGWLEEQEDLLALTVLATSDLHTHAIDWDYYADGPFDEGNVGLARVATLVEQLREERGEDTTLLLDNGDTFQGNPLGSYFSNQARITEPDADPHPMSVAMNALGFDAMVAGNHEFNYGLDFLAAFEESLDFPLLAANVREDGTGDEAYEPYTVITVEAEGHAPVDVGVLGLTTPGSAVWDRSHVEGQLTFEDGVATAAEYVPVLREEEDVDVVVVLAHTAIEGGSSYGDAIPEPENFGRQLAEEVPGIDAIVAGHSHIEVPEERVVNEVTGDEVVITQPAAWGRFLSVIDLRLADTGDGWDVVTVGSETRSTAGVEQSPTVLDVVTDAHDTVVEHVNSTVGESVERLGMEHAYLEDVPALDLVNRVQTDATEAGIVGTEWEDLPVLSLAAPFNLDAQLPEGPVSIRDIAGLYIYDNTLVAVEMTGAELADYLEWSAEFFEGVDDVGPHARGDIEITKPSYNYDALSGVTYDLDLAQPVGERVVDLAFEGEPIAADASFVVATNNYRANGGGGAPHVADVPIVWDSLIENRQMIIDWVVDLDGPVDPADFASVDWRLVADGEPIAFTD